MPVKSIHRIYSIALGLGHLLAILVLNMAQDNYILVGCVIKKQSGNCNQGIEPSAGLVNSLGNKVSWITLLKNFLIFKRIVPLCKWHGTRIKPAIDNLCYSMHLATALWTLDGNCVNVRTMQLNIIRTV